MAKKFKQYTGNMSVIIKNALVEIHYFISMVNYYHQSLQQVYFIITTKFLDIKLNLTP